MDLLTSAQFNGPIGIALTASGTIYVTDRTNKVLRAISPSGEVTTIAGSGASGAPYTDGTGTAAKLNDPRSLAFTDTGELYMTEYSGHRVRRISWP